ncbi:MAG TPA: hypothetical protein VEM59_02375 [Acidimicrobiia bacterium]|jgi:hypothetical protein|nr:hypothetical protein [Acidimicrobiia bacterium]
MPKSRSRYARAQARARYRKPKRRGGSFGWNVGIALVAVLGVALVIWTVAGRRSEAVAAPRAGNPATGEPGDHWHASLDVYACSGWLTTPAPEFETKADNPDIRVGIHSHGDGLIHIHPFNSSESGKNATLGKFLEYGGWSASSSSLDLWPGSDGKAVKEKNGDACKLADGSEKKGTLTWYVNGKKQSGNPSEYQPKDRDKIALVFAPEGTRFADLGTPPNSQRVPTDETPFSTAPGGTAPSTVPETPPPSAPPSS